MVHFKINYKTLYKTFQEGSMKNVDVKATTMRLQCSLVKKIFDGNHLHWKIIPLFLINEYFGKIFSLPPKSFFQIKVG